VKRILLWLIVAVAVVAAILLYRSHSGARLDVAPDAAQQIEKAKRR
jgi:hypothetical protein